MKIRKPFLASLAIWALLLPYSSSVLAQVEPTSPSTSQEPTTETDITTAVTTINSLSESTESSVTTTEPRVETTVPSSEETTTEDNPETSTSVEAIQESTISSFQLSVNKGGNFSGKYGNGFLLI